MNPTLSPAAPPFNRRAIPPAAREGWWHAADGWPVRRIDWPGADGDGGARGSLLFMPGRGDIYEKYLEAFDHWHARGWHVTACDWRAQAGSGRLGADPLTGHIDDFGIWTRDLADFWAQWTRETPGPHVLVGHSMGGHLALRALIDHTIRPAAVVLSAPMLGFIAHGVPTALLLPVARVMARLGDRRRAAWKWSEKPGSLPDERMNLLTSDLARYEDEAWWRATRPGLTSGAASWGWLVAALASTRAIEKRGAVESVDVPVLVLTTDADALVCPRAIRRVAARLPDVEVCAFGPESRHEMLREADPVRERALAGIDGFLDRVAPRL